MERITVFTPTYNRATSLHRVYESLCLQTYTDFLWIIVDDGSNDNTKEIVKKFQSSSKFKIIYIYEENRGKHYAINRALMETTSEFFLIADSDDSFTNDALQTFIEVYDSIPDAKKSQFKGVIAKCYNGETGESIGKFPKEIFDGNDLDSLFKLKLRFEKWNFIKTSIMKEIPFPEPDEKLKFFPETVVWCRMARKYKTRYVDKCLRAYYHDQSNSIVKNIDRSKETRYLWLYYINEAMDYLWKSPKYFFQAFIGLSRDTILSCKKLCDTKKEINKLWKRLIFTLLIPIGYLFAKKKRG